MDNATRDLLMAELARLNGADADLGPCTEGHAVAAQAKVQTTIAVLERMLADAAR